MSQFVPRAGFVRQDRVQLHSDDVRIALRHALAQKRDGEFDLQVDTKTSKRLLFF